MKIVVCIKQVPDVKDIQWTEQNTMKRDGVESIINPCDLYAIRFALDIKKSKPDSVITAISMGPKQAETALRQAIALGVDKGYLICDKKVAGSDTLATSYTLSSAIRKIVPDFDIVVCGQYASDGDTAQTGVGIAQNLEVNQVINVNELKKIEEEHIIVEKDTEDALLTLKLPLPCVVCVQENKNVELAHATIKSQIIAQDAKIEVLSIADIGLDEDKTGIKGSPTFVFRVFRPEIQRGKNTVKENTIEFVKKLIDEVTV